MNVIKSKLMIIDNSVFKIILHTCEIISKSYYITKSTLGAQYLLDASRLSDVLEDAAYDPPMPVDTQPLEPAAECEGWEVRSSWARAVLLCCEPETGWLSNESTQAAWVPWSLHFLPSFFPVFAKEKSLPSFLICGFSWARSFCFCLIFPAISVCFVRMDSLSVSSYFSAASFRSRSRYSFRSCLSLSHSNSSVAHSTLAWISSCSWSCFSC